MKASVKGIRLAFVLSLAGLLAACGGGGGGGLAGGGIGGTGITTTGTITGFGSVFVNGIEFETGSSSFDVDDAPSSDEDDLAIGMVVTVVGTVNSDGVTGDAESIYYDDELEGPVTGLQPEDVETGARTFTVFNITVVADRLNTVFDNTDFDSLANNDLVEVSGYFDASGRLLATRIEKEGVLALGVSSVEIKGVITGFDNVDTFTISGITVTFDGTTDLSDLPGGVVNDQLVEVEGILDTATSITATRIEAEDDSIEDTDDSFSVEGIVTDFSGTDDFRVAGIPVDASGALFLPDSLEASIDNGDKVEVEGTVESGVLIAYEVELRGGDVRVSGITTNADPSAGTLTVEVVTGQPLTLSTSTQTQFGDERDGMDDCSLDTVIGVEVEVEAVGASPSDLQATQVRCDDLDEYALRGPADVPETDGDANSGTVSILGVSIQTEWPQTDFENALGEIINPLAFFSIVEDGDLIGFRDDKNDLIPSLDLDGIADEVEFED